MADQSTSLPNTENTRCRASISQDPSGAIAGSSRIKRGPDTCGNSKTNPQIKVVPVRGRHSKSSVFVRKKRRITASRSRQLEKKRQERVESSKDLAAGLASIPGLKKRIAQNGDNEYISEVSKDIIDILQGIKSIAAKKQAFDSSARQIIEEHIKIELLGYSTTQVNADGDVKLEVNRSPQGNNSTTKDRPASVDPVRHEFADRQDRKESIVDFINRVWGDKLDDIWCRSDLRRISPNTEMSLRNYERTHGRVDLAILNLPTRHESNVLLIKRGRIEELLAKDPLTQGEIRQLSSLQRFKRRNIDEIYSEHGL